MNAPDHEARPLPNTPTPLELSRRLFAAVSAAGIAALAGTSTAASAADPAAPPARRAGSWWSHPTTAAHDELTGAFRRFGDSGGGWSNHGGWAASDGTYSAVDMQGRLLWLMNDTFCGPVTEEGTLPSTAPFINGTILVADDKGHPKTTVAAGTHEEPESIASPPDAVDGRPWYWNQDGIIDGGKLRVFQARIGMTDGEPPWNFEWQGTDIVTYTPDLTVESVTSTHGAPGEVSWGVELFVLEDHLYIYGAQGEDNAMHLARCRIGHLIENDWEFYADGTWSDDPTSSSPIIGDLGASWGVTRIRDRFVLLSTATDIFSDPSIYVATAASPTGPFEGREVAYTAPEGASDRYTYNVATHPTLSAEGELVFSYNVGQSGTLTDADNARPKFATLRFDPC